MKYPLFKVATNNQSSLKNISDVLESGFINEGMQVTNLRIALHNTPYFRSAQSITLMNSCTSAITIALKLAGVEPGDNVVTTSMTCVATNMPIITMGANIRWADVDPMTGMLDPNDVEHCINNKTKAVIVVAWAGNVPYLKKLAKVCQTLNVKLIIDAAHAFGATLDDKQLYEFADYTCYSFQAIKHFTTGDGGALVCRDRDDARKAEAMKWFGIDRHSTKDELGNWKGQGQQWNAPINIEGYKANMNNVAAAIGLASLDGIDYRLALHRRNADIYEHELSNDERFILLQQPPGAESSRWVYSILVNDTFKIRNKLLDSLNNEGIGAGRVHVPNHKYDVFKYHWRNLPGTDSFDNAHLALPCGWWLSDDDVRSIADAVKSLV